MDCQRRRFEFIETGHFTPCKKSADQSGEDIARPAGRHTGIADLGPKTTHAVIHDRPRALENDDRAKRFRQLSGGGCAIVLNRRSRDSEQSSCLARMRSQDNRNRRPLARVECSREKIQSVGIDDDGSASRSKDAREEFIAKPSRAPPGSDDDGIGDVDFGREIGPGRPRQATGSIFAQRGHDAARPPTADTIGDTPRHRDRHQPCPPEARTVGGKAGRSRVGTRPRDDQDAPVRALVARGMTRWEAQVEGRFRRRFVHVSIMIDDAVERTVHDET